MKFREIHTKLIYFGYSQHRVGDGTVISYGHTDNDKDNINIFLDTNSFPINVKENIYNYNFEDTSNSWLFDDAIIQKICFRQDLGITFVSNKFTSHQDFERGITLLPNDFDLIAQIMYMIQDKSHVLNYGIIFSELASDFLKEVRSLLFLVGDKSQMFLESFTRDMFSSFQIKIEFFNHSNIKFKFRTLDFKHIITFTNGSDNIDYDFYELTNDNDKFLEVYKNYKTKAELVEKNLNESSRNFVKTLNY